MTYSGRKIRLLGVPIGLGAGNPGAEGGDRAVRTAELNRLLQELGYDVEDCGSLHVPAGKEPGNPKAKFLEEIAETNIRLSEWMQETMAMGAFPLVVGGDHSLAAGTVAGTSAYYRQRDQTIGVIWIDAHADMNTPEISPSGNVHGMPLAASLGHGAVQLTHLAGFSPKCYTKNTVLVGIRDIDQIEHDMILETGVRAFTIRDIDERGMMSVMHEAIECASDGTAGFHVSLDMDALDPTVAPGVGTPVPGGLSYREAHLALEMVADTQKMLSFDVVEVNPMLDSGNSTANIAVGLIASGLGKRILNRRVFSLNQ